MARLYNWYIEKIDKSDSDSRLWAKGIVTGHARISDATFIHTSPIVSVTMEGETVMIQTLNTKFECEMENADYAKFTETNLMEGFLEFKEKYDVPEEKCEPDLQENEALFVLGNNREYYFESYNVSYQGKKESLYDAYVHVGTVQDSVLCELVINSHCMDYRYFPYKGCHVEFYAWEDSLKTYIENCGDDALYVTVGRNVYIIPSKERKLITPQNAEKEKPRLGRTDLYDIWNNEKE